MEGPTLLADALSRVREQLHDRLDGLSIEQLHATPYPSIAWLAWHLTRVQDSQIAPLAGREQLWTSASWHERFGMEPDPRDYGPGHTHTPAQVQAFRVPDAGLLLDYHDAVTEASTAYLASLTSQDLDRVLDEPRFDPKPTVGVRLVSVVDDNVRHMGQIEYLRGLAVSGGWFPRPAN